MWDCWRGEVLREVLREVLGGRGRKSCQVDETRVVKSTDVQTSSVCGWGQCRCPVVARTAYGVVEWRDRVSGVKGPRAGRYVGAGVMANRRAVKKLEPLHKSNSKERVNRGPCGSRQALLPYDQSRETANSLPVGWLARLGPGMQIRAGSCPAKGANRRCRPARTTSEGTPFEQLRGARVSQGAERAQGR